jgi:hypothetical protein
MSEINISGTYVYRSLINNQDVQTDFNDLEFGRGTMNITQKDSSINGTFDMGGGYKMTLEGTLYSNDKNSYLRMTGYGVPGTITDKWVYDYFGIIIPVWPKAVAQVPTIMGSVIRSVDHGSSKAGVTATFYMVLIA